MNRSSSIKIAGAVVFVTGVVLGSISVLQVFGVISQPRNAFVNNALLGAGESQTLSVHVYNPAKPVNVLLSNSNGAQLKVVISDPRGNIILDSVYTQSKNLDTPITELGTYKLVITNLSSSPAKITAAFRQTVLGGHEPITTGYEEVISLFAGSTVMFFAGIVLMIFGLWVSRTERKQKAGLAGHQ